MTALLEVADGIARVRLNRPEAGNALDLATARSLHDAARAVAADADDAAMAITASGPLGLTSVSQLTTTPYAGNVAAGLSTIGVATLNNATVGPTQLNGNMTTLASYVGGTNSVTITVDGVGSQSGSLSPSVLAGYNGSANGVVYLQYIYAIPEPAVVALFALGLLMLGAVTMRRRQD